MPRVADRSANDSQGRLDQSLWHSPPRTRAGWRTYDKESMRLLHQVYTMFGVLSIPIITMLSELSLFQFPEPAALFHPLGIYQYRDDRYSQPADDQPVFPRKRIGIERLVQEGQVNDQPQDMVSQPTARFNHLLANGLFNTECRSERKLYALKNWVFTRSIYSLGAWSVQSKLTSSQEDGSFNDSRCVSRVASGRARRMSASIRSNS